MKTTIKQNLRVV